jgi:uncharacterized protein (DUF2236 family)
MKSPTISRVGSWMISPLQFLARTLAGDLIDYDPQLFLEPPGEPAVVGPGSVTWQVFGNPVALAVGGIAAVLLELGEPRVRAGVWDHSSFRRDPRGRIRRTGLGALITAFAGTSRLAAYAERVNGIHGQVQGRTPAGEPYRADQPELLRWVQATAAFCFAESFAALVRPLSPAETDSFYAEAAVGARYYRVADAPAAQAEMARYLAGMRSGLSPSPVIGEFLEIMRTGPVLPAALRPLQPVLVRAAVELVPAAFREQLGIAAEPMPSAAERRALRLAAKLAERIRLPDDPRELATRRVRTRPPSGSLAGAARPRS